MNQDRDQAKRNPGPSWGYDLISFANRCLPWAVMRCILKASALISMALMREQRKHSRTFLREALGREPSWQDCWKHFEAFSRFLVRRFEAADGRKMTFETIGNCSEWMEDVAENKIQVLHGTFHYGNSDLMGFWLSDLDLSIRMVRFRVGNSRDVDWLEKRFGGNVGILWVNDPANMLYALKAGIEAGHSIAMKCDRVEHSSKVEAFEFLGKKRLFPFTIYHLAILFDVPVAFSFGLADGQRKTQVRIAPLFRPQAGGKRENLARARVHFQETLRLLEDLVREEPFQWFNFLDSNPVWDGTAQARQGELAR